MTTANDATASAPYRASAACRVMYPGRRMADGTVDPRPVTALLHPDGSVSDVALLGGLEPHSTRYMPCLLDMAEVR